MTAAVVGVRGDGVSTLHDATECGLWGGLFEVARASRVGMRIEQGRVPMPEEVEKICRLFAIDPFSSISEGTLVLTRGKAKTAAIIARLAEKGITAAAIGETCPESEGVTLVGDGRPRRLEHSRVDPFWKAFGQAVGRPLGAKRLGAEGMAGACRNRTYRGRD